MESKWKYEHLELVKCCSILYKDNYKILESYKGDKVKIDILCKKHGIFKAKPNSLKSKRGCPQCGKELSQTWTYSKWEQSAKKSLTFDSFKVYVIFCYDFNLNESFIKIGRTWAKTNKRFYSKSQIPYEFNCYYEFVFQCARKCCEHEKYLHNLFKEFSYVPKLYFKRKY